MGPSVTIAAERLQEYCEQLATAFGCTPENAAILAQSLVASNLRAIDSHGVLLLLDYLNQIELGDVDPRGTGKLISESGVCAVYDGQDSLGQPVAVRCAEIAVRLAGTLGIGLVVSRNTNHFGAAAHWAKAISAHGMIGIVLCNAPPRVPPWQGKSPRFGTNPICMSVPHRKGEKGWLLDMATTRVALGKIYDAKSQHRSEIPEGWATDQDGQPTQDLEGALSGFLMPLGGYKGSGLQMMVEILCSVLSGSAMLAEMGSIRSPGRPMRASQFFLAIDVSRFLPLEEFQARMQRLVDETRASENAAGYDEVMVAGDPEWRAQEKRLREGIPLPRQVWDDLGVRARQRGVQIPAVG